MLELSRGARAAPAVLPGPETARAALGLFSPDSHLWEALWEALWEEFWEGGAS